MTYLDDACRRRPGAAERPADDHDRYYDGDPAYGDERFPPWTDTLDDHEDELA